MLTSNVLLNLLFVASGGWLKNFVIIGYGILYITTYIVVIVWDIIITLTVPAQ